MAREQTSNDRSASRARRPVGELVGCWQQHRDRQARDAIFEQFLPLARRLAWRYANRNEPMEDLAQVAGVGLLGAIDRFDTERGTPFVAFAIRTIMGELRRYFRDPGWSAHVPRGAQEMALRVDRASQEITAQTGRPPRVSAIAEYLEIGLADVLVGLDAGTARYADSLDAAAPGTGVDEPHALGDTLGSSDGGYGFVEARLSVVSAINRLPFQQRQAFVFGWMKTCGRSRLRKSSVARRCRFQDCFARRPVPCARSLIPSPPSPRRLFELTAADRLTLRTGSRRLR